MIEPTDEMRAAAYCRAREWAVQHQHQLPDDRMLDVALAAVLAIVERDHCLEVKGHVWHPLAGRKIPRCPVVDDLCPGDANGVLCDRPCGPPP